MNPSGKCTCKRCNKENSRRNRVAALETPLASEPQPGPSSSPRPSTSSRSSASRRDLEVRTVKQINKGIGRKGRGRRPKWYLRPEDWAAPGHGRSTRAGLRSRNTRSLRKAFNVTKAELEVAETMQMLKYQIPRRQVVPKRTEKLQVSNTRNEAQPQPAISALEVPHQNVQGSEVPNPQVSQRREHTETRNSGSEFQQNLQRPGVSNSQIPARRENLRSEVPQNVQRAGVPNPPVPQPRESLQLRNSRVQVPQNAQRPEVPQVPQRREDLQLRNPRPEPPRRVQLPQRANPVREMRAHMVQPDMPFRVPQIVGYRILPCGGIKHCLYCLAEAASRGELVMPKLAPIKRAPNAEDENVRPSGSTASVLPPIQHLNPPSRLPSFPMPSASDHGASSVNSGRQHYNVPTVVTSSLLRTMSQNRAPPAIATNFIPAVPEHRAPGHWVPSMQDLDAAIAALANIVPIKQEYGTPFVGAGNLTVSLPEYRAPSGVPGNLLSIVQENRAPSVFAINPISNSPEYNSFLGELWNFPMPVPIKQEYGIPIASSSNVLPPVSVFTNQIPTVSENIPYIVAPMMEEYQATSAGTSSAMPMDGVFEVLSVDGANLMTVQDSGSFSLDTANLVPTGQDFDTSFGGTSNSSVVPNYTPSVATSSSMPMVQDYATANNIMPAPAPESLPSNVSPPIEIQVSAVGDYATENNILPEPVPEYVTSNGNPFLDIPVPIIEDYTSANNLMPEPVPEYDSDVDLYIEIQEVPQFDSSQIQQYAAPTVGTDNFIPIKQEYDPSVSTANTGNNNGPIYVDITESEEYGESDQMLIPPEFGGPFLLSTVHDQQWSGLWDPMTGNPIFLPPTPPEDQRLEGVSPPAFLRPDTPNNIRKSPNFE